MIFIVSIISKMGFLNNIRALFPVRPISADKCNEMMYVIHPKWPGDSTPEWEAERLDGESFMKKYNIISYGGMFYSDAFPFALTDRDSFLFTMTILGKKEYFSAKSKKNRVKVRQAFIDRCAQKGLQVDPRTIIVKQQ